MNEEKKTEQTTDTERIADSSSANVEKKTEKKCVYKKYVIAVLVVGLMILGVIYLLEKEGRSSTAIFSPIIEKQLAAAPVAIVNGKKITNNDLEVGLEQFRQMATAQGADLSNPDVEAEIRTQALDVLVNTELLKQKASEQGIEVSDEEVEERIEAIKTEIGGEDVLMERMASLGIAEDRLRKDVKDELLIQRVLDSVLSEDDLTVTEEEVVAFYENVGGEESGLPALEEIRDQIEAQVRSTKEQALIDEFLTKLKEEADVEIK